LLLLNTAAVHMPQSIPHPCALGCPPLQACNRQNLYCVPLYDSLGENAIEYIIKHAEATAVFAQSEKLGTLAKSLPHVSCGSLSLAQLALPAAACRRLAAPPAGLAANAGPFSVRLGAFHPCLLTLRRPHRTPDPHRWTAW
jgi:hypothetical protein